MSMRAQRIGALSTNWNSMRQELVPEKAPLVEVVVLMGVARK